MRKSLSLNLGLIITVLLAATPFFFWFPHADFSTSRASLLSMGQICALTGYVLYLINFILSARFRILDKIFYGINRMYISHHLYGVSAFILLILHPLFITLSYLTISLSAAYVFVLPSFNNLPQLFGTLALLVTIILLVITLYLKVEYDRWKITHKFLGLALFFSGLHILFIGSTLAVSLPLRVYFYILALTAMTSYLYGTIFEKYLVKKEKFIVSGKDIDSLIIKISLIPVDGSSLKFEPGQFVFMQFIKKGRIQAQSHPFSMTSSPGEEKMGFGIKILGEYTDALKSVKKGDPVLVEGPYGRFSYSFFPNPKQIWIAGGIGVTPFVSLAKSLPKGMEAILYYSVTEKSEAVYYKELSEVEKVNRNFKLVLWESKFRGRFSISEIEKFVNLKKEYFICGPPPMMKSLKSQLISIKIPQYKIHTEEFSLS